MAEQLEEFDDFKPAKVDDGVNDSVKKVVEKEMTELETFKVDTDDMLFGYEEPKQALTDMMIGYIQNVGDVNEVNLCSFNSGNGEAIDAWGYSGDEDITSIDLFLTVLVNPEKVILCQNQKSNVISNGWRSFLNALSLVQCFLVLPINIVIFIKLRS